MNIQGRNSAATRMRAARRLIEQAADHHQERCAATCRKAFLALLFAGVPAEDLVRYEARELAELAEAGWQFLQERKAGAPKIRFEFAAGSDGRGARPVRLDHRDRQRRHAVPARLGDGRAHRTGRSMFALVLHPIFTVERDQTGALIGFRGDGPAVGAAQRESFIHIHRRAHRGRGAAAQIVEAIASVLADVRLCVQDWRPMLVARRRADRRDQEQSAAAAGRRDRRGDAVPRMAGRQQLHVPRRARVRADRRRARLRGRFRESGLGILRSPDVRVLRRGSELVSITPEIMEFLQASRAAHHHQGERALARAPARAHGLHRREALRRDGKLVGEFRIVGLFTSTAYTRSTRSIPYLRRKVDNLMRRSGFDPGQPFRQGARRGAGKLLRATSCSRSTRTRCSSFALAIMQLDERPRVRVLARRDRFDRFVSVIVFVPRDRYDSLPRGSRSAPIWRASTRAASRPSIRPSPKARWCACTSSSARCGGETPNPDRADARERGRGARAHLDRRARRGAHAGARADQGAAADRALSRRLPGRLSRGLCAGDRGRRHPADREPLADPPARRRLLQPPRGRTAPARV